MPFYLSDHSRSRARDMAAFGQNIFHFTQRAIHDISLAIVARVDDDISLYGGFLP